MKKNKHIDGIIGIGTIIFSFIMYLFVIPCQIKDISYGAGSLAPSIFPKIIVSIIGILGLCLTINNFMLRKQTKLLDFGERSFIIVLFLILYLIFIILFGYYISTGFFLFFLMIYLDRKKAFKYLFISAIFLVVNYLFFEKLLNLILPRGYLFSLL